MSINILSFVLDVIIYGLGFYAGRQYMIRLYSKMMAEDTEGMIEHLKNIQKIKDTIDSDETEVVVEQHNNSYYVYKKTNNLFLGQGPSLDEAMKVVTERFPNEVFFYEETN